MNAFAAKKKVGSPESVMNAFAKGKKDQKATTPASTPIPAAGVAVPAIPTIPTAASTTAAATASATAAVGEAVNGAVSSAVKDVEEVKAVSAAATSQSVVNAFSKGVKKA